MPKFFRIAYFTLLVALPAVLFFSYYPIISLGANASMNFELSLPLIWLVLFDLISLANFIVLFREHKDSTARLKAEKGSRKRGFKGFCEGVRLGPAPRSGPSKRPLNPFILLLLFPLYATLSILWSTNPLRATLTAGILWLLVFAIFAIIRLSPLLNPPSRLKIWVIRAFFASTALVCLFCFIQSLLDSCGLSREITLLCAGCTYRSFGFPHPSGFTIEPQFMGNLLLAPTLLALYLLVKSTPVKSAKTGQRRSASVAELARATEPTPAVGSAEPEQNTKPEHIKPEHKSLTFPHLRKTPANFALAALAVLFSTTLFFTFSRGAIYSYALGLFILIIFALRRHTFRPALIIIPIATFLLSLGLQGTFARFGPTSETFTSAITKSIHQLSLGLIDLRANNQAEPGDSDATMIGGPSESFEGTKGQADAGPNVTPSGEHSESITVPPKDSLDPYFDGYVAASTDIRLGLNSTALATWSRNPKTILFGVGLGGAGIAMYHFDPISNPSPKEIVQNQPISLLLETGLLGIVFLLLALYVIFRPGNIKSPKALASPGISPFWAHPALPLLAALIAAYLLSLQFFAGLPNALHIYLLPPLFYYLFQPRQASSFSACKISKIC